MKNWPRRWVGDYYCRPCNRVVSNVGEHAPNCAALQTHMARTGKTVQEALTPLGARDCPDCYLGFKGKTYCPTCGNTKEPPLDDTGRRRIFGRPSIQGQDLVDATQRDAPLEPGQWYKLKVVTRHGAEGVSQRTDWITAKCLSIHGPIALLSDVGVGNRGVWKQHSLEFKEIQPIEDPYEDEEPIEWKVDIPLCDDCGHPAHRLYKCASCSCDLRQEPPKSEATSLLEEYNRLMGR